MQSAVEYVTEICRKDRWGDERFSLFLDSIFGNSHFTQSGVCDIPGCDKDRTSLTEFNFCWGDKSEDGHHSGAGSYYLYVCPQHYSVIRLEAKKIDTNADDRFFD
jgi:hypothetical protein